MHSFYIPDFRVKMDCVPNRYTSLWFECTEEGTYDLYCTEYCGDGHSRMAAKVVALSDAEYQAKKAGLPGLFLVWRRPTMRGLSPSGPNPKTLQTNGQRVTLHRSSAARAKRRCAYCW